MVHRFARRILLTACVCLAGIPGIAHASKPDVVIAGIRIVDTEAGTVSAPSDITVENGVITSITPARRAVRAKTRIDGRGQYVLAGLWDLHVHLESTPDPKLKTLDPASWYAPIAMSYGVVGLRDLGSRMGPIVALRNTFDESRRAGIPAPRLKIAGSSFMGPVSWGTFDHVKVATSADDAARQVRAHVASGVDIIKVHDFLTKDIYQRIVTEAVREGRPVTGHLRPFAGPLQAIALGQRDFEHLQPELFSYCTGNGETRAEALYAGWYQGGAGYFERSMAALYDEQGCASLFAAMGKLGATVTPTITSRLAPSARSIAAAGRYLPAPQREQCVQFAQSMSAIPAEDRAAFLAVADKALVALVEARVNVLTGSDGAPENCAIPGLILLDELDAMVEAGLPRAYVLDAATRRAAAKAGVANSGVVASKMSADLIILQGNPLDGFGVLAEPAGLVIAGRYLDRSKIEAMRAAAAESVCCDKP